MNIICEGRPDYLMVIRSCEKNNDIRINLVNYSDNFIKNYSNKNIICYYSNNNYSNNNRIIIQIIFE